MLQAGANNALQVASDQFSRLSGVCFFDHVGAAISDLRQGYWSTVQQDTPPHAYIDVR